MAIPEPTPARQESTEPDSIFSDSDERFPSYTEVVDAIQTLCLAGISSISQRPGRRMSTNVPSRESTDHPFLESFSWKPTQRMEGDFENDRQGTSVRKRKRQPSLAFSRNLLESDGPLNMRTIRRSPMSGLLNISLSYDQPKLASALEYTAKGGDIIEASEECGPTDTPSINPCLSILDEYPALGQRTSDINTSDSYSTSLESLSEVEKQARMVTMTGTQNLSKDQKQGSKSTRRKHSCSKHLKAVYRILDQMRCDYLDLSQRYDAELQKKDEKISSLEQQVSSLVDSISPSMRKTVVMHSADELEMNDDSRLCLKSAFDLIDVSERELEKGEDATSSTNISLPHKAPPSSAHVPQQQQQQQYPPNGAFETSGTDDMLSSRVIPVHPGAPRQLHATSTSAIASSESNMFNAWTDFSHRDYSTQGFNPRLYSSNSQLIEMRTHGPEESRVEPSPTSPRFLEEPDPSSIFSPLQPQRQHRERHNERYPPSSDLDEIPKVNVRCETTADPNTKNCAELKLEAVDEKENKASEQNPSDASHSLTSFASNGHQASTRRTTLKPKFFGLLTPLFITDSFLSEAQMLRAHTIKAANAIFAVPSLYRNSGANYEAITKDLFTMLETEDSPFWRFPYYSAFFLLAYFCAFGHYALKNIHEILPAFVDSLREPDPGLCADIIRNCRVLAELLNAIYGIQSALDGNPDPLVTAIKTLFDLLKDWSRDVLQVPVPVYLSIAVETLCLNGALLRSKEPAPPGENGPIPITAGDPRNAAKKELQRILTEELTFQLCQITTLYLSHLTTQDEVQISKPILCNLGALMNAALNLKENARLSVHTLSDLHNALFTLQSVVPDLMRLPNLEKRFNDCKSLMN
ncbi:hypothetical protein GMRT_16087 [Giardia muris]|uniref:Uncharacterized protein n=1 Tax=Giardia muris TaxID=5742 RepID=A0A4Z1T1W1_GIAMU|nr:hypothetical protein GMRT_16087 [Giardia muris]|eukprot:TNJ27923.1 hypothetical protein GMRT_16087 [Giardia muris]